MEKTKLNDELIAQINKIEELELEAFELTKIIEEAKQNNAIVKMQVGLDVVTAVTDEGKPLFSNNDKREAEIHRRLSEIKSYQEHEQFINAKSREYEVRKIKISSAKRMFTALKTIIGGVGND